MSVVSNRHTVSPFIAGKSAPLNGQRLAKIGYKKTKDNPNPLPSVFVSVPYPSVEEIQERITRLLPHIGTMLESVQDKVIRSIYESAGGNLSSVSDEEISIDACIAFMEAESAGSRLSGDLIGSWFDSQVKENLTVVIADKLGFTELNDAQMGTIQKHLNSYRALFVGLSGKNVSYSPVQLNGLEKALEVSSVDDAVSEKISARITALKAPKPTMEELLDL